MALTDSEKGAVIYHLGYPAKTMVPGTIDYSQRVMERLTGLPVFFEARIRKACKQIDAIDDKLIEAQDRFSTSRVDDIELNPEERMLLVAERKRVVLQLSHLVDLPLCKSSSLNIGVRI